MNTDPILARFVGFSQLIALRQALRGEEGEWFHTRLTEMAARIRTMPQTYDQDGLDDEAIAHLHYFTAGADFWITERDVETDQNQAFGLARIHEAELGYISIPEILRAGAELDLHFTPTTIGAIRAKIGVPA